MAGAGRVLPAAKWQLKDKIALVGTLPPEASGNSVAEASQYLGVYTRGQLKFFAQVKGNPYSNHGYYEQLRDPEGPIQRQLGAGGEPYHDGRDLRVMSDAPPNPKVAPHSKTTQTARGVALYSSLPLGFRRAY